MPIPPSYRIMIRTPRFSRPPRRRLFDVALGVVAGVLVGLAMGTAGAPSVAGSQAEALAAPASSFAGPTLTARGLDVVDGDTFEARVAAFPGQEIVARVRVDGVDAPERNGRCRAEREAAEAATAALAGLIGGRRLTLTAVRGDKYFGRVVARVSSEGRGDVAGALITDGHGRRYAGGKRAGWC